MSGRHKPGAMTIKSALADRILRPARAARRQDAAMSGGTSGSFLEPSTPSETLYSYTKSNTRGVFTMQKMIKNDKN